MFDKGSAIWLSYVIVYSYLKQMVTYLTEQLNQLETYIATLPLPALTGVGPKHSVKCLWTPVKAMPSQ